MNTNSCWHNNAVTSASDTTTQTTRYCPDCGATETTFPPIAAQPKDPEPGPVTVGEAFKRERRYVVFKVSDIKRVPAAKAKQIYDLARWFDERRMEEHRSPMTCVVVEHDWPEYEPTWAAIQQRMEKSK